MAAEGQDASQAEGQASCTDKLPRTLWWAMDDEGLANVYMIDQSRLPVRGDVLRIRTHEGMVMAIQTLALRGAPAIGVGGAYAMALWAWNESDDANVSDFMASMEKVGEKVGNARPTAVNLSWAVQMTIDAARAKAADLGPDATSLGALKQAVVDLACKLDAEDIATNMAIGRNGAELLAPGSRVMTHCNAGSLATVFYGTALGVVYSAFDQGRVERVYACETRPVNQGGRLTTWELMMAGVPVTLICDDMAATVMSKDMVDAVIVGADRIAANGDAANKIGTMGHAVLAKHFGIPFYVAAPSSTIDASIPSGDQIRIEQRDPREVEGFTGSGTIMAADDDSRKAFDLLVKDGDRELSMEGGHRMSIYRSGEGYAFDVWIRDTPVGVDVFNPAFDVTPANLITAIITESGVFRPDAEGSYHF